MDAVQLDTEINIGRAVFYLFLTYLVGRHYRRRSYPQRLRYRTTVPRFWAGLVDQAVLFPSKILLGFGAAWLSPYLLILLQIAIDTAYSIWLHARYGQTVGKWVCKIKIVDHLTGTPISLNQAILRDSGLLVGLLYAVAVFKGDEFDPDHLTGAAGTVAGVWFILEIITMLMNKKRRALHDFLAGTVVVRTPIDADPAVSPPSVAEALKPSEDQL